MNNTIYFYTGTGNSLWTAKNIARLLGDTELISMVSQRELINCTRAERVGLIFPVHMWGVPRHVINFIHRLIADPAQYFFAVAVNAGQVAATLIQLKKMLQGQGIKLSAGFSVGMPSNYIPWGGAIAVEKQLELFNSSLNKINLITKIVQAKEIKTPEKGPSWQNFFLSGLSKIGSPRIPEMDKSFWVDAKCTGCQICEKICPSKNIIMTGGRPIWQHHCEQCLACIQWCPAEAIQYGKNCEVKKRYHHPDIKLSEILTCNAKPNHNK